MPNENLKGRLFPRPKGPASLILEPMRDWIWNTLNCFWNPKITCKYLADDGISIVTRDADIVMSPRGWTAEVDLTSIVAGSGSSTVPFSGSGAPSSSTLAAGSYVAGPTPSLYVDLTAKVLYVCTTAGTESTSVWAQISGGGSSAQFKIVGDGGDYWNCHTWNGSTEGSSVVKVAKDYKIRCDTGGIVSETIEGRTFTYTYTLLSGSYIREVKESGSLVERDLIKPPPLAGDIINAISFSTAAPSTLSDVVWLDINSSGRQWQET